VVKGKTPFWFEYGCDYTAIYQEVRIMPSYDYRCKACKKEFTLTYNTIADHIASTPVCPKCGSQELSKLIKRVRLMTGDDQRMERLADPSRLGALEGDDPRAMGRMMRELASESGEPLPPELSEVTERLESGESPESIEQSMPDLGDGGSFGGDE
jgi:putative FmdB family regulatory protein